ncbi:MAG TPA: YebC/PmpR family DNA-binding transcriptional regulator [Candidatus Portnoybacteria bacterium]|jgi:YebC/PmpR family DNA-binding regulatory protein|nr:YebC/PmpR family DNA-binding transcriptional regulator [Candidatus Portnoybacteria bacterium]MDD5752154.1 YebC/PmpR family DNA-binding transcriptional regulator [Candidatus Portnoybacteria bacterium]HOZ16450.1 YebC/PmpR family DNA-binding transcriptional regulator [Candidatus Portnoybacteria bacterium]HPH52118.1 YebC/PmpR family DNA-binding transcriptional regulator [Candidatus Portnoybacteria bacterium]HPJ80269.1 YebC/PmpR family DNA-binding transcriptional regulator [Candidatus Portnoybact
MSGHNKWANIKVRKGAMDKKRGKIFSKMAKFIEISARKGGDPVTNPSLRMAIDKARSYNMPNDNIQRAIKKGTGENKDGAQLEEVIYEAYGPEGSQLILEIITDNKNRTISEVRHILDTHDGRLAENGSVKWNFNQMGVIRIDKNKIFKPIEELELSLIDVGAEDIKITEGILEIKTLPENLEKTKETIKKENVEIEESGLEWIAKNEVNVSEKEKDKIEKLFEALDENDDVNEIYSNVTL